MPDFLPFETRVAYANLLHLPDAARSMGIHLLAGKGSGKSRLMGRVIAWADFIRGIPVVILDPVGPTIDNFLDRLTRMPREYQERLWKRVMYVDMSGSSGTVVPMPLYYRLGTESYYSIAQRYLDVIRRVDPALQSASVEGFNALWRVGTYVGMVLAALDCQITEAEHLLRAPQAWLPRIHEAAQTHTEIAEAASFFTDQYLHWKEEKQVSRTDAFRTKAALLTIDPALRAMFGAERAGLEWGRAVQKRQTVLLDFRNVHDLERRRFLMLWAYMSLLEFVKHRGAGRHRPISLIVDELAALANFRTSTGSSLFADDLEELINVYARNCSVWLTLAHQEMYQFEERIQKTLMTMGTHIFGVTSDPEAALSVARQMFFYDPEWIKRRDPLYMNMDGPYIVDERLIEFTAEEQSILNSAQFRRLQAFHFLVRPATGEGTITGKLTPVTIHNLDRGQWVNDELVGQARSLLSQRNGVSIQEQLAAIQKRLEVNSGRAIGTMNRYEGRNNLSIPEEDDDTILYEEKAAPSEESRVKPTAWVPSHLSRR